MRGVMILVTILINDLSTLVFAKAESSALYSFTAEYLTA